MPQAKIHVMKHGKTGLLAGFSDDLPGFIVHAHDDAELHSKLAPAFQHFMSATGQPVHDVRVKQSSPEGFWPPTYIAKGELDRGA